MAAKVATILFFLGLVVAVLGGGGGDGPACDPSSPTNCGGLGRRRRLRQSADLGECLESEYEVRFYLDDVKANGNPHAFLLASPIEPGSKCSSILLEEYVDDIETLEKVKAGFVINENKFVRQLQKFTYSETVWTFPLGDILDAFDNYRPKNKRFDIVKNNCTRLVIGVLRSLGVQFTNEDAEFGAGALSGYPNLIEDVKKSSSYRELYKKGKPPETEEVLLERLAEYSLSKHGGYEPV